MAAGCSADASSSTPVRKGPPPPPSGVAPATPLRAVERSGGRWSVGGRPVGRSLEQSVGQSDGRSLDRQVVQVGRCGCETMFFDFGSPGEARVKLPKGCGQVARRAPRNVSPRRPRPTHFVPRSCQKVVQNLLTNLDPPAIGNVSPHVFGTMKTEIGDHLPSDSVRVESQPMSAPRGKFLAPRRMYVNTRVAGFVAPKAGIRSSTSSRQWSSSSQHRGFPLAAFGQRLGQFDPIRGFVSLFFRFARDTARSARGYVPEALCSNAPT